MKPNTILALVVGILIGAAGGRLAKSVPQRADGTTAGPVRTDTKRSDRDDAPQLEKSRAATRWIDRIAKDGVKVVAEEIPTGDMRALMEKMMTSMWGSADDRQLAQLAFLMRAWAERDAEAALAWARTRDVPQQREIALTGVAAVVGKTDPMAGFAIYEEIGEVSVRFGGESLMSMMHQLFVDAAAEGVDAMLDLSKRIPANRSNAMAGVSINYPEGFDFPKLMDGLAAATSEGGDHQMRKAFQLSGVIGKWALQDPDAAFDYAITRTAGGQRVDLSDVAYDMGKEMGSKEAKRWMGEKLATLRPEQTAALLPRSGLLNSPGILREYIAAMPEEAVAEFRFQAIQASPATLEILLDIPEVDDRVAMIERLRGVKDPKHIRAYLVQWQVPEERIDQVVRTVTQPEE